MNPVVLFSSVGSGHNDLLVAFLVAVALALLLAGRDRLRGGRAHPGHGREGRRRASAAPVGRVVHARAPAGRRLRTFVTHAGLAAAIWLVFAAPFLNLHDPSLGMFELAGHEGWLAPSRFFRRLVDAVSGDTVGVVARIAFAVVLLTMVVLLVREVWRRAERTRRSSRLRRRAARRRLGLVAAVPDAARSDPPPLVRHVGVTAGLVASRASHGWFCSARR